MVAGHIMAPTAFLYMIRLISSLPLQVLMLSSLDGGFTAVVVGIMLDLVTLNRFVTVST